MNRPIYKNDKGIYFTPANGTAFTVYLKDPEKALKAPKTDKSGRTYWVVNVAPKFTSKGNIVCVEPNYKNQEGIG